MFATSVDEYVYLFKKLLLGGGRSLNSFLERAENLGHLVHVQNLQKGTLDFSHLAYMGSRKTSTF